MDIKYRRGQAEHGGDLLKKGCLLNDLIDELIDALVYALSERERLNRPAPHAVPHVPMLEWEGKPVNGLKRCSECGISETYWERWPTCPEGTKPSAPSPVRGNQGLSLHYTSADQLERLHRRDGDKQQALGTHSEHIDWDREVPPTIEP
jgi:hypothetical protein